MAKKRADGSTATAESAFHRSSPDVVSSAEGELRINRVGLKVTVFGEHHDIESEMIEPPMSLVVYFSSSSAAQSAHGEKIRQFVDEALAFRGFHVEYI